MGPCPEWQAQFDEEARTSTVVLTQACGVRSRVLQDGHWHRCDMAMPGHVLPHVCRCPQNFGRHEEAS